MKKAALWLLAVMLLIGCADTARHVPQDSAPPQRLDPAAIEDAVPQHEQIGKAGNYSPYTVLGVQYQVLATAEGYKEQGLASWYGTKFHGRKTSNGEVYNMYSMTAAHKTLPIPCYVRVRNLENGKQTIVRINDRGPFHAGRIIDLSYAAATKLGIAEQGTARVEVEHINVSHWAQQRAEPKSSEGGPTAVVASNNTSAWLQAGVYGDREKAVGVQRQLMRLVTKPVVVSSRRVGDTSQHRVRVGPISDKLEIEQLRALLSLNGISPLELVYD